MRAYIENFTGQLSEALSISEKIHFGFNKQAIQNIVIAGLGGSGIGGSIVKDLVFASCPIPIIGCKDYNLPNFVNKNTLVICNSYSGNTEETIEAYHQAKKKGALIFCISTGGKLIDLAKADNFPFITFPGGNPPRACLAYSLVQLLVLFEKLGLHNLDIRTEINTSIANLDLQSKTIEAEALPLAKQLHGKIPVLYALEGNDGLVTRFQQQLQENAKILCWHNIIPEMNHNELVGWADANNGVAVLVLRSQFDYEKNIKRLEIIQPIIKSKVETFEILHGKGNSPIQELLYFIHLTDWMSFHLSELRQVDSIEVNVIDFLKSSLSQ